MADIAEHARKGEERDPADPAILTRLPQEPADHLGVGHARGGQPGGQRNQVGQSRQRQADQKEDRRIEEGVVAHVAAEQARLGRLVRALVDLGRVAAEGHLRSGPEADEVRAERLAHQVEPALGQGGPGERHRHGDREPQPRIGPGPVGRQPVCIPQRPPQAGGDACFAADSGCGGHGLRVSSPELNGP